MIELIDATKRYRTTTAVDGLSFTVHPGQVTGFLGPNGAGKSTTMRLILGLDALTTGRALVNGRPYRSRRRPLHEVGALLDADAVHGGYTAYQHLLGLARSNGIGRGRVAEVLEQAGLAGVARRRVRGFSLGMKQRLGIAAALLGNPSVLLFDEPINGLDPAGIRWIRGLLTTLAGQGRTVFVSSHLMSEMALVADRVIVVGQGRLVEDVGMSELNRRFHRDVLVCSPRSAELVDLLTAKGGTVVPEPDGGLAVTGLDAPTIGDLAAEHGIAVHELTPRSASLEEAFLELTDGAMDYRATEVHR